MKTCPDCGNVRPDHASNCPGWTDADDAEIERRRMNDDPWSYLLEAAEESLHLGPAQSMDRAKRKLRAAIAAVKDELREQGTMIRLAPESCKKNDPVFLTKESPNHLGKPAIEGRGRDWSQNWPGRTNA